MARIGRIPSSALEVRDLRLILALEASGTTGRAAALLGLTQPAVSRALVGLEDRLGAALFERSARGLVLTAAGERLASSAPQLLASLVELERRVREPERAPTRLRIVCECYTAYHWLPTALSRLRQSQPGLEVTLAVEHTARPLAALESGDIDAALLTTARVRHGELREQPLFSDEVTFVLSPKHALAAKRTLTPADLCSTLLLTSNTPEAEARWFMASVFGRARPRLCIERLPLTEAVLDMARAGMGVAVLSHWMASAHLDRGDLVARRLAKGPLRRPWRLAWRRELGDAGPLLLRSLAALAPQPRLVSEREASLA